MSDSAAIKRVVFAESIRFTRFILCAQIVCHITGKPSVVIPAQVHFFQSLCVAGFPVSPPVIHVSPTEPELFAPERGSQVDEVADSRRCFKQGPSGGYVLWYSVLAQITRDDVKMASSGWFHGFPGIPVSLLAWCDNGFCINSTRFYSYYKRVFL